LLQALLTDMAAHSHVVHDINKMADDMIASNHGKMPAVKKRRDEINNKYVIDFCFISCNRLSRLPVNFRVHVKYYSSYTSFVY